MILKHNPEDFRVEEQIYLPGHAGGHVYYRIEKRGVTTLAVQQTMAEQLQLPPRSVVFPALKDAHALAVQYASAPGKGPEFIRERGFTARRIGWGPRPLQPGDLIGNRFVVVARNLERSAAQRLVGEAKKLGEKGFPNYFDSQRFGSLTADGFIGKAILLRDAESAMRYYLAEVMLGDPAEVRAFKAVAREHWPNWNVLFEAAPRPSNFRSVLTFLKDHPTDYRKALNLIPLRLLSIYLAAYQSWLWNRILARLVLDQGGKSWEVEIAETFWPIPAVVDPGFTVMRLPLPESRARYFAAIQPAVEAVLIEEGLTQEMLRARILQKAYLTRGERAAWLMPKEMTAQAPVADSSFEGRWAVELAFTLPPGSYATLALRVLAARIEVPIQGRW